VHQSLTCYLQRPANIEHICLAEFASSYTKKGKKRRHSDMPYVIRYVRYSEHKDPENFYREHLMLYVPYRVDENIFQKQYSTWKNAYMSLKETIKKNEQNFTYKTTKAWGNLDDASSMLEARDYQVFNRDVVKENQSISINIVSNDNKHYEEYDIDTDLQHFENMKKIKTSLDRPYPCCTTTTYIRKYNIL
jgi:hypothetical protein